MSTPKSLSGFSLPTTPPDQILKKTSDELTEALAQQVIGLLAELASAHDFFELLSCSPDRMTAAHAGLYATLLRQFDSRANEMEALSTALAQRHKQTADERDPAGASAVASG